jgi:hypothetical protein
MRNLGKLVLVGMMCCTAVTASQKRNDCPEMALFNERVKNETLEEKQAVILDVIDHVRGHYDEITLKVKELRDFFEGNIKEKYPEKACGKQYISESERKEYDSEVTRRECVNEARKWFVNIIKAIAIAKKNLTNFRLELEEKLPYKLKEIVLLINEIEEDLKSEDENVQKMAQRKMDVVADLCTRAIKEAKKTLGRALMTFFPRHWRPSLLNSDLRLCNFSELSQSIEDAFAGTNIAEPIKEMNKGISDSFRKVEKELFFLFYNRKFIVDKVIAAIGKWYPPEYVSQELEDLEWERLENLFEDVQDERQKRWLG